MMTTERNLMNQQLNIDDDELIEIIPDRGAEDNPNLFRDYSKDSQSSFNNEINRSLENVKDQTLSNSPQNKYKTINEVLI